MYAQTLRRTDASVVTRILGILVFAVATALSARLAASFRIRRSPLTLQVLVVVLSGYTLGGRDAMMAQGLYLQAILLGAPLTASGLGGPAALVGPTAGYLISFPLAALAGGWLSQTVAREAWWGRALGGLGALAIIYGLGTLWLSSFVGGLSQAFALGVVPFVGRGPGKGRDRRRPAIDSEEALVLSLSPAPPGRVARGCFLYSPDFDPHEASSARAPLDSAPSPPTQSAGPGASSLTGSSTDGSSQSQACAPGPAW